MRERHGSSGSIAPSMRPIPRSPSSVVAIVAALAMGLGSADLAAQQPARMARIGFLHPGTAPNRRRGVFRNALNELGYVEGRDVTIEFRWAEGHLERLSPLAAELVALKVDVIVVGTTPAIKAVSEKTKTIPIVMTVVADPVADGLVQSLGRPGGNLTGLTIISPALSGKRIELPKEAVPRLSRLAVLWNPANPTHTAALRESQVTAKALGLQNVPVPAQNAADVDGAFATTARDPPRGRRRDPVPRAAADRGSGPQESLAPGVRDQRVRRRRRALDLRRKAERALSPGGGLRRPDPQGRQAGEPPHRAALELRARPQPQDRKVYRSGNS